MSSRPRILIVDDDEDNLANLSDILSEFGFQIDLSNCGLDALAMAKLCAEDDSTSNYDLCLLDFKMPGINGAELIHEIRQIEPDFKAIMITAYAGDDGVERAISAGTWKVLSKPVNIEHLLNLINQALAT